MSQLERRFLKGQQVQIRAGSKPAIEGYASVFNEQYDSGWFIETIKPGAFQRALEEKDDVRCLMNHDPNNLLGRTKSGTLTMQEDAKGLRYVCDLNPDSRIATEVHSMISRGDLDGCSFAFRVLKQTWREEVDPDEPKRMIQYRDIQEVELFDVGPVTYPAYEGTSVGARALWPEGVPGEIRSHIPALAESIKRDGEEVTPLDPGDGDDDPDGDDDEMEECSCMCRACFGGDCDECDDYMETCSDPGNCSAVAARAANKAREKRDGAKTKRVAGEDLAASAFAYVGDETDTSTWKLPIKFSTDDKTKRHIQNALARFGQTQGIPAAEKPKVLAKIKAAAKKYGIHVSDDQNSAQPVDMELLKKRTAAIAASLTV